MKKVLVPAIALVFGLGLASSASAASPSDLPQCGPYPPYISCLQTITYPDGSTVTWAYNKNGVPHAVK